MGATCIPNRHVFVVSAPPAFVFAAFSATATSTVAAAATTRPATLFTTVVSTLAFVSAAYSATAGDPITEATATASSLECERCCYLCGKHSTHS